MGSRNSSPVRPSYSHGSCRARQAADELGAHVIAKGSGGLVEHVLVGATDDLGDLVLLGAVEDGRGDEERTGDVLVGVGLVGIPTAGSSPAKVALEQLADVHTRRNAQRVEDNVDRGTVSHVGHVLDRQNVTDNALVAVAAGDLSPCWILRAGRRRRARAR